MQKNPLVGSDGETITDLFLITPSIFHDNRGYFYESWNQKEFDKLIGQSINFLTNLTNNFHIHYSLMVWLAPLNHLNQSILSARPPLLDILL